MNTNTSDQPTAGTGTTVVNSSGQASTGSQYTDKPQSTPEDSTTLVTPIPPKTDARYALVAAIDAGWEGTKTIWKSAEAAILEAVGNSFPEAATARFEPVYDLDGFDISFSALLDADGKEIPLDEDDYQKYDDLSDELDEFGNVFTNAEYVESNFGTKVGPLLFNLKPAAVTRTVEQADAELEALDAQMTQIAEKRVQATCKALALSVRGEFKDAQTLHFQHASNLRGRTVGRSGLALTSVDDAEGNTIWNMQDQIDQGTFEVAYEWQQSLTKYIRQLDSNDKQLTPSAEKHFGVDLDLGPSAR